MLQLTHSAAWLPDTENLVATTALIKNTKYTIKWYYTPLLPITIEHT